MEMDLNNNYYYCYKFSMNKQGHVKVVLDELFEIQTYSHVLHFWKPMRNGKTSPFNKFLETQKSFLKVP